MQINRWHPLLKKGYDTRSVQWPPRENRGGSFWPPHDWIDCIEELLEKSYQDVGPSGPSKGLDMSTIKEYTDAIRGKITYFKDNTDEDMIKWCKGCFDPVYPACEL